MAANKGGDCQFVGSAGECDSVLSRRLMSLQRQHLSLSWTALLSRRFMSLQRQDLIQRLQRQHLQRMVVVGRT